MPQTPDDALAETVFNALMKEAKSLTVPEMMQLNQAYRGMVKFSDLTPALRWKFRNIGASVLRKEWDSHAGKSTGWSL